jgi:enamine deaminase RidA (YjgF/YER057c/UK114 family)
MLVYRDIDAFIAADWEKVSGDFLEDQFVAVNAGRSHDVGAWAPEFDTLDAYRVEWLRQAREAKETLDQASIRSALFALTDLKDISIKQRFALVRKCFDGYVKDNAGNDIEHQWQTLYFCRKPEGQWKISGFLGYLPYPLVRLPQAPTAIHAPPARQHATAGPYSPVLEIRNPGRLIVISGQAAIDMSGAVVGATIEEQTRLTLENCATQLRNAACTFADVFKVTVYLSDLEEWARFNTVYEELMPEPYPARVAVQTGLLSGLKVEIDMWAATN